MDVTVPVIVIGGGIAGLSAAHHVAERLGPGQVLLLEAGDRLGGKIVTEEAQGFVIEGGPDCFLASKPAGIELCRQLGLEDRLRETDASRRRSFVKKAGRLHELPQGISGLVPSRLGPLLRTGLLSVAGKTRAALEIAVPRRRDGGDESIAAFARRRFGREAYDWLIEPLLGGIYAGDGEALSLGATFPAIRDLERRDGTLLRHLLRRQPRTAGAPTGFVTMERGLGQLVQALEQRLRGRWLSRAAAVGVRENDGGWTVRLWDGRVFESRAIIVAAPAWAAGAMLAGSDPALAAELEAIPYVDTATVSVAFAAGAVTQPLPGHGYVSPRAAGGSIVACTWTSNKFPTRVPPGAALLRVFIGRAGHALPPGDDDLVQLVRDELAAVHGITAAPLFWRSYRWPRGMPQYVLGHGERLARLRERQVQRPGLSLAGAAYSGVGIPDCITSGSAAADHAVDYLGSW